MIRQSAFFLVLAAASSAAIELTPDNFHNETDGKTVFIKFFAPWCGHCQSIKPDWDKLIADFEGSPSLMVADVDCTAEGEQLCKEFGIQGYPTLKWGDPSDLQDYNGGRSYEDLKQFADEYMKPQCSIKNVDLCDDEKMAQIQKYQGMNVDELSATAEREDEKMRAAEGKFEAEVAKLHAKYGLLSKEKDDAIAGIKAAGLGLLKSVLKSKN